MSNLTTLLILTSIFVVLMCIVDDTKHQMWHHQLTSNEFRSVFEVDDGDSVPDYQLVVPETTGRSCEEIVSDNRHCHCRSDDRLHVTFVAWQQRFGVDLRLNRQLVSPHVMSIIRAGHSSRVHSGLPHSSDCHYSGSVLTHRNASASVSNCNRNIRLSIAMPDHFIVLNPVPRRLRRENDPNRHQHDEKTHVIFRRSTSLIASNYTVPTTARLDSQFVFPQMDRLTMEIALFLDSRLLDHFEEDFGADNAEMELLHFSLALINNVHTLYQQPTILPKIDVVIVRYEIWKEQPKGLETLTHKNGQAQRLLDSFCRFQAKLNPGSDLDDSGHWDHGILLTGYDIYHTTTSVAGVAPVARMCDHQFSCSLVEGLHLGRSFVLTHEIGHSLGMVHDGEQNQCSRSCCLMSAINGAGKTTWSECSVREMNTYLLQLDEGFRDSRNCLRDPSGGPIPGRDHLADDRPPGQRYTGDEQCAFFWGRDFQVELPVGRHPSDLCRVLWCGNNGTTISTAHPALEGTWCGEKKRFQWCSRGDCVSWPDIASSPRPIDGVWSHWSTTESCPREECRISGGVRVRTQTRTCSNPAHNNGGRPCMGLHIRGIFCDNSINDSTCQGVSEREFGDTICSAFRHDFFRPDLQLNGKSFLHDTQLCKVWCHLSGSDLVRNKGLFPNGSPCGRNKFCMGGLCLSNLCSGKAVVGNALECPESESWSSWSVCSVSCGDNGQQTRSKACAPNSSNCPASETRPCPDLTLCPDNDHWSEWSICSHSCDSGRQIRRRLCSGSSCTEKNEEEEEEKYCNEQKCPENSWSDWSECSVTCGSGVVNRKRGCFRIEADCSDGQMKQTEICTVPPCPDQWGDWSPCSSSCGLGIKIRRKICSGQECDRPNRKQALTCKSKSCPSEYKWENWSDWAVCSATCDQGIQLRSRGCIFASIANCCLQGHCPRSKTYRIEHRNCSSSSLKCPSWSPWSPWSHCSITCGQGLQNRHRTCTSGLNTVIITDDGQKLVDSSNFGLECPGPSEEHGNCDSGLTCLQNIHPLLVTGLPENEHKWTSWQQWESCSLSCGGGIRKRVRMCQPGFECTFSTGNVEREDCNTHSCDLEQWSEWSTWSECSKKCDRGRQARERHCSPIRNGNGCRGFGKEERSCNSQPCSNLPVDLNRIFGILSHTNSPQWSLWSSWSKCSCFDSTQIRRRYCVVTDPTVRGFCTGPLMEQRACTAESCLALNGDWSSWGDWSRCSSWCSNSGIRLRHRMCSQPIPINRGSYCIGQPYQQQHCNNGSCTRSVALPVDGQWTDWTAWSECTQSCYSTQRSRTRFCSKPPQSNGGRSCEGRDFQLQPCPKQIHCSSVNGAWGAWSVWSVCGVTCGYSFQFRNRHCDSPRPGPDGRPCVGLAYMTSICAIPPCQDSIDGGWTNWSNWSECTGNCGYGSRIRTRVCESPTPSTGGFPCFGRSSVLERCPAPSTICSSQVGNARLLEWRTRSWETSSFR